MIMYICTDIRSRFWWSNKSRSNWVFASYPQKYNEDQTDDDELTPLGKALFIVVPEPVVQYLISTNKFVNITNRALELSN